MASVPLTAAMQVSDHGGLSIPAQRRETPHGAANFIGEHGFEFTFRRKLATDGLAELSV